MILLYSVFLIVSNYIPYSQGIYTEETPVKFLQVEAVADRYPASDSEYRISVSNGFDEDANPGEEDLLNGFPEMRLILNPGGCADYSFPVEENQGFLMLHPARKPGVPWEQYCPKGKVDVKIIAGNQQSTFECFPVPDDCASSACLGDFHSLLSGDVGEIHLNICVNETEVNTAAIWEINISEANESSKIEGVFMEEAKARFQLTQMIPDFNTQLSLVSIVGDRGVGKSTVASLLSGNHSMFKVGSSSAGTTTTGTDISTIIPTTDYSEIMGSKLGIDLNQIEETLPLFLLDSEGMKLRGDAYDFITTTPPAVIAKAIIWIGTEALQTKKILDDIKHYLNGLDNIIMDDGEVKKIGEKMCNSPNYGHFIVVINKMMGNESDDTLLGELMRPEPDYIPGSEERNEIRRKITDCFDGISLHGLPQIRNLTAGQEIDYSVLDQRFKEGLAAIANTILERTLTPRIVSVGGISLELNSTTAEVIISTVIEEANEGEIDLTGFQSFWKLITWEVDNEMAQSQKSLDISLPLCEAWKTVSCSLCACSFRNDIIEDTLSKIEATLILAAQQAMEMFGEDVSERKDEIFETKINPWVDSNLCSSVLKMKNPKQPEYCDFSEMAEDLIKPSTEVSIACQYAFLCTSHIFDASNITISADNIYFSQDTKINVLAPAKADSGLDAQIPDGSPGGDGMNGKTGTSLFLSSNVLLPGSKTRFVFTSQGGDGGDGGQGGQGVPGLDGTNGADGHNGTPGNIGAKGDDKTSVGNENDPKNANDVFAQNSKKEIDSWSHNEHHCWCNCNAHDWWKKYEYKYTAEVYGGDGHTGRDGTAGTKGEDGGDGGPGGQGGKGGNGGNGGQAGDIYITGVEVTAVKNRIGGQGGLKGNGGPGGPGGNPGAGGMGGTGGAAGDGGQGGMGVGQLRRFYCKRHHHQGCNCGLDCGHSNTDEWTDEFSSNEDPYESCCQGRKGDPGLPGANGGNGNSGNPGEKGQNGEDGNNGLDA